MQIATTSRQDNRICYASPVEPSLGTTCCRTRLLLLLGRPQICLYARYKFLSWAVGATHAPSPISPCTFIHTHTHTHTHKLSPLYIPPPLSSCSHLHLPLGIVNLPRTLDLPRTHANTASAYYQCYIEAKEGDGCVQRNASGKYV